MKDGLPFINGDGTDWLTPGGGAGIGDFDTT